MRKLALHWQILIAILLAGVVGYMVNQAGDGDPSAPSILGIPFLSMFQYVGTIFLNALKMIIVPLIMSSIIVGMSGIGASGNLGALGGRTLLFYAVTTLAAIIVGLVLINLTQPGISDGNWHSHYTWNDFHDYGEATYTFTVTEGGTYTWWIRTTKVMV